MDLSIIVTNYKKEDLLPLQLRMIHKQWSESRDMRLEVIIVDHYSHIIEGDKRIVQNIVSPYCELFPQLNISLYNVGENNTFNSNIPFNVGAKRAKGEFIMFLPSDCMPLSPLHKHLEYHKEAGDILLRTGLINLPSFYNWILKYNYNFKKYILPCPSTAGGSVRTKHYHAIRGLSEYQTGAYTQAGLVSALCDFTHLSLVSATDLFTIHFDREIHPDAMPPYIPKNSQRLRDKYIKDESMLPLEERNPNGWGDPPKLMRIL